MVELELEKTFLLARIPEDLAHAKSEIIRDAFIPASVVHPITRIRQRGERYEITKKEPIEAKDSSRQEEHTIKLTPEEFRALNTTQAKRFAKRRFYCTIGGYKAEVDFYFEDLKGLAIIDFEFETEEAMAAFVAPDICLADVTQEEIFAGGMLAGKTYQDLKPTLDRFHYKPLTFEEQL